MSVAPGGNGSSSMCPRRLPALPRPRTHAMHAFRHSPHPRDRSDTCRRHGKQSGCHGTRFCITRSPILWRSRRSRPQNHREVAPAGHLEFTGDSREIENPRKIAWRARFRKPLRYRFAGGGRGWVKTPSEVDLLCTQGKRYRSGAAGVPRILEYGAARTPPARSSCVCPNEPISPATCPIMPFLFTLR